MFGWLLGTVVRFMEGDTAQVPFVIHINCVDDVEQDTLLASVSSALRRPARLVGSGRYQYGSDIQVVISYGSRDQASNDGKQGTGHLHIGRMQAKGYTETDSVIRIDLPLSKYDINKRYDYCISQITNNIRLVITQLYCLNSLNPLEFYAK